MTFAALSLHARSAWAAVPHNRLFRSSAREFRSSCSAMALPEQFMLKNKTIVVTGASRGIGLEVSFPFASNTTHVLNLGTAIWYLSEIVFIGPYGVASSL
jgi:hypothetical protein